VDRDQALEIIDRALGKIPALRASNPFSAAHVEFHQTTGLELARIFGPDSPISQNFSAITYRSSASYIATAHDFEAQKTRRAMGAYQLGLEAAEGILRSARGQLTQHGVDRILSESRIKAEGARAFISHGKETPALGKVERFVRALGLEPVIVGRGPSEGMSVDDLVEARMGQCDCAIILATADEAVDDRRQPRPNVIHEIGLAQEKFKHRVIYLKEQGCEFPSNVRAKVWENFTQDNMELAFEKISKELRAFSLL
jgi:predicted nucleotide-binding protein